MTYAFNLQKIKKVEEAIKQLESLGLENVLYLADLDIVGAHIDDVIKLANSSAQETVSESQDSSTSVASDIGSVATAAVDALITVGERIRERKLSSYFQRSSLKRAGIVARNLYKAKYGNVPERNAKQTYVYNKKDDLELLDEAINTVLTKAESKRVK